MLQHDAVQGERSDDEPRLGGKAPCMNDCNTGTTGIQPGHHL